MEIDVKLGGVTVLCVVRHGGAGNDEQEDMLSRATCIPTSKECGGEREGKREGEGETETWGRMKRNVMMNGQKLNRVKTHWMTETDGISSVRALVTAYMHRSEMHLLSYPRVSIPLLCMLPVCDSLR